MKSAEKKKINLDFWDKIFSKMNTLLVLVKELKGNYDMDDTEIRWVEDRIQYWNDQGRMLTKDEMLVSNNLWQKYNGPINVVRNGS